MTEKHSINNIALPKYKKWVVDYRLREFRLVSSYKNTMKTMPFNCIGGIKMLNDYEDKSCPECKNLPCQCCKKSPLKMFKRIKLPGFMVWFIKKRYFLDSLEEYLRRRKHEKR